MHLLHLVLRRQYIHTYIYIYTQYTQGFSFYNICMVRRKSSEHWREWAARIDGWWAFASHLLMSSVNSCRHVFFFLSFHLSFWHSLFSRLSFTYLSLSLSRLSIFQYPPTRFCFLGYFIYLSFIFIYFSRKSINFFLTKKKCTARFSYFLVLWLLADESKRSQHNSISQWASCHNLGLRI